MIRVGALGNGSPFRHSRCGPLKAQGRLDECFGNPLPVERPRTQARSASAGTLAVIPALALGACATATQARSASAGTLADIPSLALGACATGTELLKGSSSWPRPGAAGPRRGSAAAPPAPA